MLPHRLQL